MPDTKITALAAITTVDPAADVLPIVDISDTSMAASGTTKKITTNQILGSGGTATLASATITGDLTVDTSTLKVDSANNRVGVLTASPAQALDVASGNLQVRTGGTVFSDTFSNYGAALQINAAGSLPIRLQIGGTNAYEITSGNIHTWSNVGGVAGTAMTLNANGLGVGASPSYQLHVAKSQSSQTAIFVDNQQNNAAASSALTLSAYGGIWNLSVPHSATFVNPLIFKFGSTEMMTLDASGNLLVGTTGQNGSWNTKLTLSNDSGTTKWAVGPYLGGVTNFLISAGASAGVYLNGTAATSWTSASDERLKDIIEPISNAIAKVGSLRAVIGKFKFDENNTRKPFLIAQDVQSVLPEAVDASNPDKLGVAYTDVIPLLVAAIKELTARVQTLETR